MTGNSPALYEILKDTALRLEDAGITYWLTFGTLLGLVREGHPIAWDYDVDLAVEHDDRDRIMQALAPAGAKYCGQHGDDIIRVNRGEHWADLYLTHRQGIKRVFRFDRGQDAYEYHFDGHQTLECGGEKFRAPRYTESLMVQWYGPGWREPLRYKYPERPMGPPPKLKKELRVFVNGVFDLPHVGHFRLVRRAKELFGHVSVGVHTDANVLRYKGYRTAYPQDHRVEMMAGCRWADDAFLFEEDNPTVRFLDERGFDFVVHGDCGEEALRARAYGEVMDSDRLRLLPEFDGYHSSDIKQMIVNTAGR